MREPLGFVRIVRHASQQIGSTSGLRYPRTTGTKRIARHASQHIGSTSEPRCLGSYWDCEDTWQCMVLPVGPGTQVSLGFVRIARCASQHIGSTGGFLLGLWRHMATDGCTGGPRYSGTIGIPRGLKDTPQCSSTTTWPRYLCTKGFYLKLRDDSTQAGE